MMTALKHIMMSAAVGAAVLTMAGCGPSLKEYVGMSSNYWSRASTTVDASVRVDSRQNFKGGSGVLGVIASTANLATDVAGIAIESEQRPRLRRLVRPETVATMMSSGFNDTFAGQTHLKLVNDDSRPDMRVFLEVNEYGLYAESVMSPMNFYVAGEIRMVYTPEMKTIYAHGVTLSRQAGDVISDIMNATRAQIEAMHAANSFTIRVMGFKDKAATVSNVVSLVSGVANLKAFFDLTDDDIAVIFEYMSYDAGRHIASDLVYDIYR